MSNQNNKPISELLSVANDVNATDLMLISLKKDDYFVSKQIKYSTLSANLQSLVKADYTKLIEALKYKLSTDYMPISDTYSKDDIDNMLSTLGDMIYHEILGKISNKYAELSDVFIRGEGQKSGTYDYEEIDNLFMSLDSTVLTGYVSKSLLTDDVEANDENKVPTTELTHKLLDKINALPTRDHVVATAVYSPTTECDGKGRNFGALQINDQTYQLYAGIPFIDNDTILSADTGALCCNLDVIATKEYTESTFIALSDYNTETWTFTYRTADGSPETITKKMLVKKQQNS